VANLIVGKTRNPTCMATAFTPLIMFGWNDMNNTKKLIVHKKCKLRPNKKGVSGYHWEKG